MGSARSALLASMLTIGVVGLLAVGSGGACTHGIYDGSGFVPDAGGGGKEVDVAAGAPAKIVTDDKFFALEIPAGAFAAPTRVRIQRLADRTTSDVTVPEYEVTATPPPATTARFVVVLSAGVDFNKQDVVGKRLAIAIREGAGLVVLPGGVTGLEYYGLTSKLGRFTVEPAVTTQLQIQGGQGPSLLSLNASCFFECCRKTTSSGTGSPGGGIQVASCVAGFPFCGQPASGAGGGPGVVGSAGNTELSCFLECSDLDRLRGLCAFGMIQCAAPKDCENRGGDNTCCLEDGQLTCKRDCGGGQRVCSGATDCATCVQTAKCPFGTCGGDAGAGACQ